METRLACAPAARHGSLAAMRIPAGLLAAAVALVIPFSAGCGGTPKALIPVDSPLKPWEPPDAAEEGEGAEGEGEGGEAAPAPAPEPAKQP